VVQLAAVIAAVLVLGLGLQLRKAWPAEQRGNYNYVIPLLAFPLLIVFTVVIASILRLITG